jgi:hypothetical protein
VPKNNVRENNVRENNVRENDVRKKLNSKFARKFARDTSIYHFIQDIVRHLSIKNAPY